MTLPVVSEADLPALTTAFPGLDFTDPECRAVLLKNEKVDVQAAPGSGKTTILAAKLYLLGRKWQSDRQGICVISHTNTAANEIRHRLSSTPEGTRLLSYPHFIGTIHGFINQFLALPRLRSDGGKVDVIDDEVFARKALSLTRKNLTFQGWANRQHNADKIIEKMYFSGANLNIVSVGNLPSSGSPSGKFLRKVKTNLAIEGVFRHADMFAFAERALEESPRLSLLLAKRFPLVMMDEMQDTSPSQAALLLKIFGSVDVIQRFGDINQRIFVDDDTEKDAEDDTSFPEDPQLPMSTSRRFGSDIARIVSNVQEKGKPVIGKGPDIAAPPTLLVYTQETISAVIRRFGELVLDTFDDRTIASGGHVRAICARKTGDSKKNPGRHIADFWPPLATNTKTMAPKGTNAWRLLTEDPEMRVSAVELGNRVERVRRIVLLALREAGSSTAKDIRETWRLFRLLREGDFDLRRLRRVMRDIVMNHTAGTTDIARTEAISNLHAALSPLLPEGTTFKAFAELPVFSIPDEDIRQPANNTMLRTCTATLDNRSVQVTIDTVSNTKGETQLATLYLESLGLSTRFDVVEAIARQTGRNTSKGKPPKTLDAQMRHAYVGFSRPTRFLCLAINGERLNPLDLEKLIDTGWRVQSVLAYPHEWESPNVRNACV